MDASADDCGILSGSSSAVYGVGDASADDCGILVDSSDDEDDVEVPAKRPRKGSSQDAPSTGYLFWGPPRGRGRGGDAAGGVWNKKIHS